MVTSEGKPSYHEITFEDSFCGFS